jgi:cobalt-zinc-cadmium efflux system membrane fusion protein
MRLIMKTTTHLLLLCLAFVLLSACGADTTDSGAAEHGAPSADYERGQHGGRLLTDGTFALELSIFETGIPPEFRAWATIAGEAVDPKQVDLTIRLTRHGGRIDQIGFAPEDDFLRGDTVVYEPHSFVVSIEARVDGAVHRWEYDNFEGRTQIGAEIADAFGLETEIAGPATIRETVNVYGRIEPNTERMRVVIARFDGVIESVHASLGDTVKAGQRLVTIESNESLKPYTMEAPIGGVLTERNANPGEQTSGRRLFTIMDTSTVWADLAVFPADRARVAVGMPVNIATADGEPSVNGTISAINVIANENQAVTARVVLDNSSGGLLPGMYVSAEIEVAEYEVPLAVKRTGLQAFRDFTVVYAQIDDVYEVRMLELGRQDDEWVEVLGGLEPGTQYVAVNSYLVKADIEKSGASHDH